MSSNLVMITDISSKTNRKNLSPSQPNASLQRTNGHSSTSSNSRKDSSFKLPYPVLADHRHLSSILNSLQKETQTTSKKITETIKHIDECGRRLTSPLTTDIQKKSSKSEHVKFKQQLDALKKHERRVSLQIDFITTKNEIKNLEDERNSNAGNKQIQILLGKLNQKLEKMKMYMRTRNEQMKKQANQQISSKDKPRSIFHSSAGKEHSHPNKRFKTSPSIGHLNEKPIHTSTTTKVSKSNNKRLLIDGENDDDDDELHLDLDELFNDDLYSGQTLQNLQSPILP